jgi:hypothetical protein
VHRLERQRLCQEKARLQAEKMEKIKAKEAQERAVFQERTEEVTIRKAMLEKKRAGLALTVEEARAHEKLFGKAVAQ